MYDYDNYINQISGKQIKILPPTPAQNVISHWVTFYMDENVVNVYDSLNKNWSSQIIMIAWTIDNSSITFQNYQ